MDSQALHSKIGRDGRIVIPAEYRARLGINPGDSVVIHLERDAIRVMNIKSAIAEAQALCTPFKPKRGHSIVKSLIRDRRLEAKRETER